MSSLLMIILGPGELVVRRAHIEEPDQQVTIRMLVNSLFWGFFLIMGAVLLFA